MIQFDLTSILAVITFFISVILFKKDILAFIDFCHFLLIVEGVIFLIGAISHSTPNRFDPEIEEIINVEGREKIDIRPQVRFDPTRYILGLILFCIGTIVGNIQ